MTTKAIPQPFFWRRLHSLTGIWLTLFLIEHLFVNSQAALFLGDDGSGFVEAANAIKNLPYLPIIEIFLLGVPIFIHMIWGVKYAYTAKFNSFGYDGKTPYLPEYNRNKAYTWQRITAWVLMLGIIAHVIQMRFVEAPAFAEQETQKYYMVRLSADEGLATLAARLGVKLYDENQIEQEKQLVQIVPVNDEQQRLLAFQLSQERKEWLSALEEKPLGPNQVMAVSNNFGTAELLMVREVFKKPLMLVLYTIFVLFACFHGFNGLWTFLIKWGITLTQRSQKLAGKLSIGLMCLMGFLGLAAIWLTYWVNLKT